MDWFRSHHGAPSDAKLTLIAMRSGQHRAFVTAVWWEILDYASQHPDRGSIEGIDAEVIAVKQGLEETQVEAIIKAVIDKGMVQDRTLTNWSKRQPKREDNSAERTRAYRDAKKRGATPSDDAVTQCDADVTHSDAPEERRGEEIREDKKEEGPKYAFSGKVIKLNKQDYENWRKQFHAIPDFDAELHGLDRYYVRKGGDDWFSRAPQSLKREHVKYLTQPKAVPTDRASRERKANVETL